MPSRVTGTDALTKGLTVTNIDGKVVRLESGGWAQYRQIAVQGPHALTMLIAVELTEDEVRKLLPQAAPALH